MTVFGTAAAVLFVTGILLDGFERDFRLVSAFLVAGAVCFIIGVFTG